MKGISKLPKPQRPLSESTIIEHRWLEFLADKRKIHLTGDELRVLLLIFRETWGRNGRKPTYECWETILPDYFMLKTGLPERSLRRILNRLEEKGVIERRKYGQNPQFRPSVKL